MHFHISFYFGEIDLFIPGCVAKGSRLWLGSGVGPVVVSSSCRFRCVVNVSPLGGTHALRHNPFLQSMKSGGSLIRNVRFGAPKSQNGRSFSQAQYFGNASMQARRFFRGRRSIW